MTVSFKKHLIYWILPSLITIICIFIYFFDIFGLSYLIANPINREFGIIEHLQLLLLMIIFVVATKGVRNNTNKKSRQCFRVVAAACVLLFFEEIDYGLHYRDYFTSYQSEVSPVMIIDYDNELRNLHNNGEITDIAKMVSYIIIVCLFVIIPLLPSAVTQKYRLFEYLSPSRFIVLTAASLLAVNNLALYFARNYQYRNAALNGNISEFEEIMIYYIFLLYVSELAYSQKLSLLFNRYASEKAKSPIDYNQQKPDMQKVF